MGKDGHLWQPQSRPAHLPTVPNTTRSLKDSISKDWDSDVRHHRNLNLGASLVHLVRAKGFWDFEGNFRQLIPAFEVMQQECQEHSGS
ncbi:hypothetical protein C4D60_Mb02t03420 [Musa balbisiana]|uniref:Uncharacterized protein n=1 Tax=Musa balbisiana TaxID=52838 RepID=A0A4S8I9C8_MUSBA|nr:hypothetical protein C4D60_Mb02t03420 [Musa balbisiana]